MLKTLGCVLLSSAEAMPLSNRLGTFAGRQLAGVPLVDWVVRRATEAQKLSEIVVVIPSECDEAELRKLVPPDVEIFVSAKSDGLAQICDCLESHPAEAVVCVRIDAPLVDPSLLDRLITAVEGDDAVDYATFSTAEGIGVLHAQLGLIAEYCRASALRRANQDVAGSSHRNDPMQFIRSHPEQYCLRLLPVPKELDGNDLRLSLKSQEDWEHAEQVVEALGPDELDWHGIAQLLQQQPALRERMADLNRIEVDQS